MRTRDYDLMRQDIAETFRFIRYLIGHPRVLRRMPSSSVIRIVTPEEARSLRGRRRRSRVQTFVADTRYRRLP